MATSQATGAMLGQSYQRALLAEAYGKVGQTKEGLRVLNEAQTTAHKTGERFYEAELYRLKGELTLNSKVKTSPRQVKASQNQSKIPSTQPLAPSTQAEAEAKACFHKAIEIARRQQAKSLELRGVMSLSRFWQQQGKREKARKLLAEIYGWFTEGFDTADLKEAKALLANLAAGPHITRSKKRKSGEKRSARATKRSVRTSD